MIKTFFTFSIVMLLVVACGKKEQQEQPQQQATQQTETSQMMEHQEMGAMQTAELAEDEAIDPVCGMKIKKADATHTMEHNGKTYYFCMENDYKAFVANPEKYAQK